MNFLLRILITTVNAFVLAHILPGIKLDSIFTALVLAVVLALLDAIVKPLLILLTLPATILTLGLFLFVINACIILIADHFVNGFKVETFWHALFFSILLAFLNSFVHKRAFAENEKENR
jgi:putative membrane protein